MEADVSNTTGFLVGTQMDELYRRVKQTEENFVINALWQLLNRQPTMDDFNKCYRVIYYEPDFSKCHLVTYDKPLKCVLYYDNKKLGTVERVFKTNKFMMKFISDGST